MKVNWLRVVGLFMLGFSATVIVLSLVGCSSGPRLNPPKTHEQIWIEAHPTHAGPNGECIEFDDEPCDSDPHDLDDLREAKVHRSPSAKPSTKPAKPTTKPTSTRRR